MVEKEQINNIITEAIDKKSTKSYSHKPHLASLPYDHNTNDPEKLKERKEELEKRIKDTDKQIKDFEYYFRKDWGYIANAYGGRAWSLPDLLKELTTGYDIESGGFTNQGNLPLSDGREVPIHFGAGADLVYYQEDGYDVTEYALNTWELKENCEKIHETIYNHFQNITYDEDFHNYLKTLSNKAQYNLEFLEKIYNDEVSPNGHEHHTKPSRTVIDWVESVNNRFDTFQRIYGSHKKDIPKHDKLLKIKNDYTTELDRTNAHIDRVSE